MREEKKPKDLSKSVWNDIAFAKSFYFHTFKYQKYNYTDNRHGAPSHYFAYMISGHCKIVTNTETVLIQEGDIFYIPDKCSYQSYWYSDDTIELISLGFLHLPSFNNERYPVQAIKKEDAPNIYDSAVRLMYEIISSVSLCASDIGKLYTLIGMLLPFMRQSSHCAAREITHRAMQFLSENPFSKIPDIAKKCAVSEASLYKAFQKSSDISPNTFKNHLLLERAKDMLIGTDKSVEYISSHLGFSSTSYFRKKFKAYFNITPKEMRKKYRI